MTSENDHGRCFATAACQVRDVLEFKFANSNAHVSHSRGNRLQDQRLGVTASQLLFRISAVTGFAVAGVGGGWVSSTLR
jgi:hypothetical protein